MNKAPQFTIITEDVTVKQIQNSQENSNSLSLVLTHKQLLKTSQIYVKTHHGQQIQTANNLIQSCQHAPLYSNSQLIADTKKKKVSC